VGRDPDKAGTGKAPRLHGGGQPPEVGAGAGGDRQDEKLGSLVGVEAEDFAFEGFQAAGGGFDE